MYICNCSQYCIVELFNRYLRMKQKKKALFVTIFLRRCITSNIYNVIKHFSLSVFALSFIGFLLSNYLSRHYAANHTMIHKITFACIMCLINRLQIVIQAVMLLDVCIFFYLCVV